MRVKFKRNFFGKDGNRYRAGRWYNVPEEWRGHLPRDAVIDSGEVTPPVEKPKAAAKSAL